MSAPPLEEVLSGVVASVPKDWTADELAGTSGGKVLTLSRRLGPETPALHRRSRRGSFDSSLGSTTDRVSERWFCSDVIVN
jgi:hypothetical protein